MNQQIQQIHQRALDASVSAEVYIKRIPLQDLHAWRENVLVQSQATDAHQAKVDSSIVFSAVGLVTATGVLAAGGPATLGIAAFTAGAAALGRAIYFSAIGRFAELRQNFRPSVTASPAERQATMKALTESIWDESIAHLRRQIAVPDESPKPRTPKA